LFAGTSRGTTSAVETRAAWKGIPTLHSGGVKFYGGKYKFEPSGTNHGAFHWKGNVQDTSKSDGHNVYIEVRVEGYDWSRFNGKQKKTVWLNKLSYDGAALYTRVAWIRACLDRGSLHPDNCSVTKQYKR
jgi:hypothetical protein